MTTVDVLWDQFVFRVKAYKYVATVRKFQLPTAYSCSTAGGMTQPVGGFPPPPPPVLFGVKQDGAARGKFVSGAKVLKFLILRDCVE